MKLLEKRYPEKRILITGSTNGLGEAMAIMFGTQGWRVAVTGRNPEKIKASAEKVRAAGGKTIELKIEATSIEDFNAAARTVEQEWGGLDILVNNAGVAPGAPLEKTLPKDWHAAINVNLDSIYYGCQAFVPMMQRQQKGHIVIIASSAGVISAPDMVAYSASKAGAVSFAETMAGEQARNNIDVTVVCPGAFQSGLFEQEGSVISESGIMQTLKKEMATGKAATAKTIARAAIHSMEKRKLYSFPDSETRWAWRIKRLMPQTFYRLMGWLSANKYWKFSD